MSTPAQSVAKAAVATMAQTSLFAPDTSLLPPGLVYQSGFLNAEEEQHWLGVVKALPLEPMRYKNYTAQRRGISFGGRYNFDDHRLEPSNGLPDELLPLRHKVANWAGFADTDLSHVLVAEYSEGTPLGWHRDVPDFEDIMGVSLLSEAVMRFRPYPPKAAAGRHKVFKLILAPGSIYRLSAQARWDWQHSIAPLPAFRYSVTFRTPRGAKMRA